MGGGIVATLTLVYAGFTVLLVASAVTIVRKAGYSGWWVCAALVPLVNLVMLFAFAFADWPALREARIRQADPARPAGHPGFVYPPAQVATAQPQAASSRFDYPNQSGSVLPGR